MSTDAPYFGIDFGTTNSSMAWYDPEKGLADVIPNEDGEDKTPSLVYYGEDGEVLVGKIVQSMLEDSRNYDEEERRDIIQRVQRSIKLNLINPPIIGLPGGKAVRPVEVVAEILKKLRHDAEEGHFNEEIERVVITCPAMFGPKQRKVIKEAGLLAGFEEVELVEEPVAAAVAFGHLGQKVGRGVLVYDLGGGTFDVAVVTREGAGSEDGTFGVAMEPDGDDHCGGDDFDQAIYDHCDRIARETLGRSVDAAEGAVNPHLLNECRKQKEMLSRRPKATVRDYLEDGGLLKAEIDRQSFEGLIAGRVEETVSKTASMMERAKRKDQKVDTIVLIGGSTQVPLVARRLEEVLGVAPRRFANKDYAVALGAAYHAYELWKPKPKDEVPNGAPKLALESQSSEPTSKPAHFSLARTLDEGTGIVSSIAFSPDGRIIAAGADYAIMWDAETGAPLRTLTRHSDSVTSVAFSPDGRTIASSSHDKTIKLWNTQTGELIRTLYGHSDNLNSVAFNPNGRTIASGSWDDTVKVWDAQTGEVLRTLVGHEDSVRSVVFDPYGRTIASGSHDGTIKLWETQIGKLLRTLEHSGAIPSVAFSPDGRTIASGSGHGTIKLWDAKTGGLLRTLTGHSPVWSVAFSPDGQLLVSGTTDHLSNVMIEIWGRG